MVIVIVVTPLNLYKTEQGATFVWIDMQIFDIFISIPPFSPQTNFWTNLWSATAVLLITWPQIVSFNQTLGCLRKTPTNSSKFYGDSGVSGWTRLDLYLLPIRVRSVRQKNARWSEWYGSIKIQTPSKVLNTKKLNTNFIWNARLQNH